MSSSAPNKRTFQAPTGTRDFYPREMLVRRYITDAWRRVSLRHGFDEIDGPTFEHADLYRVKSGQGILNEMFGVFSGKAESARAEPRLSEPRNPPYALRPEFTPTLARMYAARAKQLPQPTKWFTVNNFFRAERPQRGRLREFWQWNCDVIGEDPFADMDVMSCIVDLLSASGLAPGVVRIGVSDRRAVQGALREAGIAEDRWPAVFDLLDVQHRLTRDELHARAAEIGIPAERLGSLLPRGAEFGSRQGEDVRGAATGAFDSYMDRLAPAVALHRLEEWVSANPSIVRGLAYYTGTVFEVIAEGERAVAGGGRYDNLIELFGGPPTPACGFGMGDAVLGNLLEDRNLIPEGREMLEVLSRPMPYRPDVFVIPSPNEGCEELVVPTVARLRRGEESEKFRQGECRPWSAERYTVPPLHVRRSYKATRNVGKLLAEASACHARFAAIIERVEDAATHKGLCTLKNLNTGEQAPDVPLDRLGRRVAQAGSRDGQWFAA